MSNTRTAEAEEFFDLKDRENIPAAAETEYWKIEYGKKLLGLRTKTGYTTIKAWAEELDSVLKVTRKTTATPEEDFETFKKADGGPYHYGKPEEFITQKCLAWVLDHNKFGSMAAQVDKKLKTTKTTEDEQLDYETAN